MQTFKTFIGLCLLKASPADLPAAWTLPVLAAILQTGVDMITAPPPLTAFQAMRASLVDTLLLVALLHTVLLLRRLTNRSPQTLAAAVGCGALFSVLSWVVGLWFQPLEEYWLIVLSVLLWYLLVLGHIARRALEVPLAVGVGLAVFYLFVSLSLTSLLVPQVVAEA